MSGMNLGITMLAIVMIVFGAPCAWCALAIVFGIGGGLVGDKIGLLLTFGNYYSELTYTFLIAY